MAWYWWLVLIARPVQFCVRYWPWLLLFMVIVVAAIVLRMQIPAAG